jgi:hypothetical protein
VYKSTSFVRLEPSFLTHSDLWNEIYLSFKSTKQVMVHFLALFLVIVMDGHGGKIWVCLSTYQLYGGFSNPKQTKSIR